MLFRSRWRSLKTKHSSATDIAVGQWACSYTAPSSILSQSSPVRRSRPQRPVESIRDRPSNYVLELRQGPGFKRSGIPLGAAVAGRSSSAGTKPACWRSCHSEISLEAKRSGDEQRELKRASASNVTDAGRGGGLLNWLLGSVWIEVAAATLREGRLR